MGIKKSDEMLDMIGDCMQRHKKMSEWEQKFINTLYESKFISEKQSDILDNIWERVTTKD